MRVVVLSSGGLDSSIMMSLFKKRGYQIFPLFIDYGQLAATVEWKACQRISRYLSLEPKRMDIHGLGSVIPSGLTNQDLDIKEKAFLPTRNLLFLTLGAAYGYSKSAHVIAIGLLSNPIFPDQTSEFIHKAEKTISKALGLDISILTPLISLNKVDIIQLARRHNLPIDYTYSCHSGLQKPCGRCISCEERLAAERALTKFKRG